MEQAGSRSLVVASEAALASAAYSTRLQTSAKVLPPKSIALNAPDPQVIWDSRSQRDIVISVLREHTFGGFLTSMLFGDEPKLPSVAQAAQLLWSGLIGLLMLTCVQVRYQWLGASWVAAPANAILLERMSYISCVALAAGLVCYPCVIIARLLFFTANRMQHTASRLQANLIFASAWCIVLLSCLALAIGAINMSANMEVNTVREDVMLGWALSALAQWLLIEPPMLLLLLLFELLLKWCTTFDDPDSGTKAKAPKVG